MTREEMAARHERVMAKIKRNGLPARPISDADRKRFEELKAANEAKKLLSKG
jgi:adenine-specific DNA methylase